MAPSRSRRWLKSAYYWLLLPLIGLGIWLITAWITNWVLSNATLPITQLQTALYPTTRFERTLSITSISARIDRSDNLAEVTFATTDLPLTELEFKLPLVEPAVLETALSEALNISSAAIQSLIQYQIR